MHSDTIRNNVISLFSWISIKSDIPHWQCKISKRQKKLLREALKPSSCYISNDIRCTVSPLSIIGQASQSGCSVHLNEWHTRMENTKISYTRDNIKIVVFVWLKFAITLLANDSTLRRFQENSLVPYKGHIQYYHIKLYPTYVKQNPSGMYSTCCIRTPHV
jgi:hypothetical protein